jgi:hypothetical protein
MLNIDAQSNTRMNIRSVVAVQSPQFLGYVPHTVNGRIHVSAHSGAMVEPVTIAMWTVRLDPKQFCNRIQDC